MSVASIIFPNTVLTKASEPVVTPNTARLTNVGLTARRGLDVTGGEP